MYKRDKRGAILLGGHKVDVDGRMGRLFFSGPREVCVIYDDDATPHYYDDVWAAEHIEMLH